MLSFMKRLSMRRADRLFQIIQIMRRARAPITADAIAEELETSKRTIYRDIATLMGQRVPIRGEAGFTPMQAIVAATRNGAPA